MIVQLEICVLGTYLHLQFLLDITLAFTHLGNVYYITRDITYDIVYDVII